MLIPNRTLFNDRNASTETESLEDEKLLDENESGINKAPVKFFNKEEYSVNLTDGFGFYRGVLVALPVSIAIWTLLVWSMRWLFN
jgi:hypothetical protein